MKASMKLIQQLRGQLPPEAAESLDELESMAGDDEEEDMQDGGADEAAEGEAPMDDEPLDDAPMDEESPFGIPPEAKKPKKKPSFFQ